jgi:hypothetical protein
MAMTQGAKANSAGIGAEDQITRFLIAHGYQELDSADRKALNKDIKEGYDPVEALADYGQKVFCQQVSGYRTLYGKRHKHDFLAYDKNEHKHGLVIEMKWQTVGGSVDEKLPFIVYSFKRLKVSTALLVMDGGGIRQVAVDWAVNESDGKFQAFPSIGAFSRWLRTH